MSRPVLMLLLLSALTACQAPPAVVPEASGTFTTPVPLDANAVWTGSPEACDATTGPVERCLREAMEASGASPAALAATAQLAERGEAGHVAAWRTVEGVGVATTAFPFRANTNEGTWLVDASGRIIDVDADPLAGAEPAHTDVAPFREAHPDAFPVAPARADGHEALDGGGVRLLFVTPMRTCRACADVGTLRVGYDFDEARRFTGRRVLALR